MGGIEPAVHVPVKPGKRKGWLLRKQPGESDVVNVMNSVETLGETKELKESE